MAANRERRSNAGARMSGLLEAEDDDDFYKTTYGGFEEEAEDNDYQTEDTASDITDSDIDVDENDEVKSDAEEGNDVKRKRRLVTKAYKEPKQQPVTDDSRVSVQRTKSESVKSEPKTLILESTIDKTSLRKSTADKTRSTEDCLKEREARAAMLRQIAEKKRVAEVRRLTQEELLAEARITEKINLRSLATYQKLELEKKKSRAHRQTYQGPIIRYHSMTVPVTDTSSETEIDVDTDDKDGEQSKPPVSFEKCSRTYITFSGDHSLYRRFSLTADNPGQRPGHCVQLPVDLRSTWIRSLKLRMQPSKHSASFARRIRNSSRRQQMKVFDDSIA